MCIYIFLINACVCFFFELFLVLFDSVTLVTAVRVHLFITHICTHTGVTVDVCGCECGCGWVWVDAHLCSYLAAI